MRGSSRRRHHINLRLPAPVGFKTDAGSIRRIGRRGIDRRGIGEAGGRFRPQIHHEQVRIAALLQAHDHPLAVGRKARRERHARKIADDLALSGLDVEQIDARVALAKFHVGDFLRRRRKPRRQYQIAAARQIADVSAVLIHQRQPLDTPLLRAGFVDEHDTAIEISLFPGQTLIDLVGNDMRDPSPVFRRGEILLAGQLLAGGDVPEAEFGFQAPVRLAGHAAGHQRLRANGLPARKLRGSVDVDDFLDIGGLIDRREQSTALEIVSDDLGHANGDFSVRWRAGDEIGNRNRQWCEIALGNDQTFLREGVAEGTARQHAERSHSGNNLPAARTEQHLARLIFVGHLQGFHFMSAGRKGRPPSGLSFGEYRRKILPLVEIGSRQIIRLAFDDRAQGAFLVDAKIRRGRRSFRYRHGLQRAIAL
ncbi:hypothetical protein GALL_463070 [mine drainage metagenome]|uniref:Uncharacterized protein n=1 Tax=mine drainage metagenome TaxID=410659 RepID=A0A1J5PKL5_9ZZZZ